MTRIVECRQVRVNKTLLTEKVCQNQMEINQADTEPIGTERGILPGSTRTIAVRGIDWVKQYQAYLQLRAANNAFWADHHQSAVETAGERACI
jgi:hypothetical protein